MTNPRGLAVRHTIVVLCVAFLHPGGLAHGDLYTDGVLSLEWLVDSSDEILFVHIEPEAAYGQPTVNQRSVLKTHKVSLRLTADQSLMEIRRWRGWAHGPRPEVNEDWLFFVRRTYRGGSASGHVFHGINLTQPLKSYSTAAITRDGKPLVDRQSILAAVEARVQRDHRLSPDVDRSAVDKLAGVIGNKWSREQERSVGTTYLKAHLGGTLVRIDCDVWDRLGADTWLIRAVVPVEPDDHCRLMEAALDVPKRRPASRFLHPIMALVNFPGQETEACLTEIIKRYPLHGSSIIAKDVLHFFDYHLEPTDPKNQALVGRWRLEGRRELIDITFTRDQTFVATTFARPEHEHDRARHLWDGQGYWLVRDSRLSIMRTHVRVGLTWHDSRRELFRGKKIKGITSAEAVLDGGPPMKRK